MEKPGACRVLRCKEPPTHFDTKLKRKTVNGFCDEHAHIPDVAGGFTYDTTTPGEITYIGRLINTQMKDGTYQWIEWDEQNPWEDEDEEDLRRPITDNNKI